MRSIAFLVLFLAACATSGTQFDTTHAHDVRVGQRRSEIVAWFGQPGQRATFSPNAKGCVERWTYVYAKARAGGRVVDAQALLVDFDPAGAVCDTAYSEQHKG